MTASARSSLARATPYAVILFAALLATLPLLLSGPSCGHDLTFHLLNWMDAAHQWSSGILRPWWCAAAAWNTGEPRFLFYPPISWLLGGLLTLVLGAARAPLAYTFLALTASGITMRRFLAGYVTAPIALLGACLYLAHPYMLFTATERTAYAELLAAAWLPWLLTEALRDRVSAPRLAIPVALLWLTNTPSAVLGTYTLAAVISIRLLRAARHHHPALKPLILPTVTGFIWGIAISALYLLPAVVQHSAVEVTQAFSTGMRPEDSTLFAHTGEALHDRVVHQASVLAVALLTVAVLAAILFLRQHRPAQRRHSMRDLTLHRTQTTHSAQLTPILLILTAGTAFLLTPASLFLWHHLPELLFLQFPWRTLMLQGVVTTALVVLAIRINLRNRWTVPLALAAVAVLSLTAHRSYAQFCDDEDAPSSLLVQYSRGAGFEPYDEYTPKDADNDLLHQGEPPAWTAADAAASPSSAAAARAHTLPFVSPDTVRIQVEPTPADHFLIVRQRSFRNWHVTLDGTPVQRSTDRDDDLLAIPLPDARPHTVTLHYEWSLDETAGAWISGVAVLLLAFELRRSVVTSSDVRTAGAV